ncbi:hypothetical protein BDW62DRAFT_190116 [Aspergillus aurantiobrunneus]
MRFAILPLVLVLLAPVVSGNFLGDLFGWIFGSEEDETRGWVGTNKVTGAIATCGVKDAAWAVKSIVQSTIEWLRDVEGNSQLEPLQCLILSCEEHASVTWCNHDSKHLREMAFSNITDKAEDVVKACMHGADGGSGFVKMVDKWSVWVRTFSCTDRHSYTLDEFYRDYYGYGGFVEDEDEDDDE